MLLGHIHKFLSLEQRRARHFGCNDDRQYYLEPCSCCILIICEPNAIQELTPGNLISAPPYLGPNLCIVKDHLIGSKVIFSVVFGVVYT